MRLESSNRGIYMVGFGRLYTINDQLRTEADKGNPTV